MRINKYIAKSGYTSRRKAEDLIRERKVKVNGIIVDDLATFINEGDEVIIGNEVLKIEEYFYYKLYKPKGYITSNFDPFNDRDLNKLIDIDKRFFAAGRLDKDSHGLLIITNDGDFTNSIIHPKNKLTKEYIVKVNRELNTKELIEFSKGIDIGNGEITSDSKIKRLSKNTYDVIIHQGYNRQIRRMFDYFNVNVVDLLRIRIGDIKIGELKPYDYEKFNEEDMKFVKRVMG